MSLQRRLLLYLLVCAPLVWALALFSSLQRARHEVNEMFDTELIRLAQQVQATLGHGDPERAVTLPPAPREGAPDAGESDVRDLGVAAWDRAGRMTLFDHEGAQLSYLPHATGFVEQDVNGHTWRVYYLPSADKGWLVAAGQAIYERDELVYGLTVTQVIPWLLVLPVLLVVMTWAVRRALAPMRQLTAELAGRDAQDLRPVPDERAPEELKPLLAAMNGLFARIEDLLVRERRFTADAAHELRTPLAVLGAQWDVVRHAATPRERMEAERKLGAGLDRMGRLVTQLLSLSRAESGNTPAMSTEIDWRAVAQEAMNDCLALAERRRIELACEWPPEGTHPMPLLGDEHLLTVLLRNLLDNAVRYAPEGSSVILRFGREHLEVQNEGLPLSEEQLARLGERFYRQHGQLEGGSGLGISIVRRIAQLHGLELLIGPRDDGRGVRAVLQFDAANR